MIDGPQHTDASDPTAPPKPIAVDDEGVAHEVSPEELARATQLLTDQIARNDRKLKLVRDAPASRTSWLRRRVVAPLKRSHWIFRLGDFLKVRLERQDFLEQQFDEMKKAMMTMASQQAELAGFLRDARQRLLHHEQGPLKASMAELAQRRKDGMLRPDRVKRRTTKRVDAVGNVVVQDDNGHDDDPKPA